MAAATGHLDDDAVIGEQEIDPSDELSIALMDDLCLRPRELPGLDNLEELSLQHGVTTRRDEHLLEPLHPAASLAAQGHEPVKQFVEIRQPETQRRVDRSLDAHGLDVHPGEIDDRSCRAGDSKSVDLDDVDVGHAERGVNDGIDELSAASTPLHRELEHVTLKAIEAMQLGGGLVADDSVGTQ